MLVIHFSQCSRVRKGIYYTMACESAIAGPIMPRLIEMENKLEELVLENANSSIEMDTYSEYPILILSWLIRTKKIRHDLVYLVSHCYCGHMKVCQEQKISFNEQGELMNDIPHAFFSQRMRYLFDNHEPLSVVSPLDSLTKYPTTSLQK